MNEGLRIVFEQRGSEPVVQELLGISTRAADARPALAGVAELMRHAEEKRFDEQGPGWAPLADSTVASKAAKGLDPRILHATMALRDSLTEHGGDNVEFIGGDELIFGTSDPKARYHQDGTAKMPQRKVLDFDQADIREFTRGIQAYVVEADIEALGVFA